jgi:hypothetical protein
MRSGDGLFLVAFLSTESKMSSSSSTHRSSLLHARALAGICFMKSNHFSTPIYGGSTLTFSPLPPHMVVFWICFFFSAVSASRQWPVLWPWGADGHSFLRFEPLVPQHRVPQLTPTDGIFLSFSALYPHIWGSKYSFLFRFAGTTSRDGFEPSSAVSAP